ncbi:hypothetical protein ABFS82_09G107000 [Erythranthe guttata]|uniref:increased DNA methylation 1-like n=1 Tax=Erythranthe guttata TaxID=4155 RepID=UPI00064E0893|nr:PREDICTED: increased DNA methylation 1-like [Erythranthe guttata]|eukprot:XP_012856714.1 PREDICTED: increased DNA methylation 1-like [Erythranthe guttata]
MMNDDELLVSFFVSKTTSTSTDDVSSSVRRPLRKGVSSKGRPSKPERRPEQTRQKNWPSTRARTILSWLIHSGVVSLNEVIQFQNPEDNAVLKQSIITKNGLLCTCCNKTLSISDFSAHAGLNSKWPCMSLFMEYGKSLILCQLEAWSAEYKEKKSPGEFSQVDEGDDICGKCGLEGELVMCDNCPAAFHQACLSEQIPEGNWYCLQCRCLTCWDVVSDQTASFSAGTLRCSLCKHSYHETCIEGKYARIGSSHKWFCGVSCHKIYKGLQSRVGLMNDISDGTSWRLLQCINGDFKAHSSMDFLALKAECNSRLAVAITVIEDYFLQMVDPKTKIDMIPQTIYNWGSQFPRLDFEGFFTIVLEKEDVMVSVASIRIHGRDVAELPFVATCRKFRKRGMSRLLLSSIEEMLKASKVEKLVLPASSPELVQTWTNKFGFQHLDEDDKISLKKVNFMLLPNSTWLKKPLV